LRRRTRCTACTLSLFSTAASRGASSAAAATLWPGGAPPAPPSDSLGLKRMTVGLKRMTVGLKRMTLGLERMTAEDFRPLSSQRRVRRRFLGAVARGWGLPAPLGRGASQRPTGERNETCRIAHRAAAAAADGAQPARRPQVLRGGRARRVHQQPRPLPHRVAPRVRARPPAHATPH